MLGVFLGGDDTIAKKLTPLEEWVNSIINSLTAISRESSFIEQFYARQNCGIFYIFFKSPTRLCFSFQKVLIYFVFIIENHTHIIHMIYTTDTQYIIHNKNG